jgi:hypothetical protein
MELPSALQTEAVSPSAASGSPPKQVWWRRPDHLVALLATIFITVLHVCYAPSVGGLWRDEVNTVNLATLPTWYDLWQFQNQDSFPLLFASTVRVWSGFFGSGDDSIRFLGLLIGLALVGAFWVNVRLMGLRFPFWSLVLVGANPIIIRYGDSARAYGLSLIFLLLMFGFIWKITQTREWRYLILAGLTAVLGVHATYYNAVLLFATCVAGCFVALKENDWGTALKIVGIGVLAALSLLLYARTFLHAHEWNFLVQYPFTLAWMWERLSEVTGSPASIGVVIWSLLVVAAIMAAAPAIFGRAVDTATRERKRLASFCGVALLIGILSYTAFLQLISYRTAAWYYLALVTFVAACIDPILRPKDNGLHRWLRAGAAVLLLGLTAIPASRIVSARHTNLDIVADRLENLTAPEDLILLTQWQCGVTMQRYYQGRTPWMTIPPVQDFRFQSHQPIIAHMQAEAPLQPILTQAERVLKSGHRVWLVGGARFLREGQSAPVLPRAGTAADGWRGSETFYPVWIMQVTQFLGQHLTQARLLSFPATGPVAPFESLPVGVVEGWK